MQSHFLVLVCKGSRGVSTVANDTKALVAKMTQLTLVAKFVKISRFFKTTMCISTQQYSKTVVIVACAPLQASYVCNGRNVP